MPSSEIQREAVDSEVRGHTRFLGSRRSRRPSPSMLNEKTAATNAAPGKHEGPPLARDNVAGALRNHDSPFGRRRSHAKPYEREAGSVEDRPSHVQRRLHHHWGQNVRSDVVDERLQRRISAHAGRFDIAEVAAHVHFRTREAAVERKIDDHRCNDDVEHAVAERSDNAHGQDEQRKRHDRIHHAANDRVCPAAEISSGGAKRETDDEGERDG